MQRLNEPRLVTLREYLAPANDQDQTDSACDRDSRKNPVSRRRASYPRGRHLFRPPLLGLYIGLRPLC